MDKDKFIEGVDKIVSTFSKYHNILEGNEAQTRWLLIDPMILDLWGFSRKDIIVEYCVDKEERVNVYDKLDYSIILNNKPKLLIEAKSLGVDLYSKISQLSDYFRNIYVTGIYKQNELIGILTDGDLYLLFTDSKEQGVLDVEPFFTIRLSVAEEEDILKLLLYSKNKLLDNPVPKLFSGEEFDLNEFYRIDMVERVFNHFESIGIELSIYNAYICGRLKNIKSFRTLYRDILKEVNKMQPNLLYNLAANEEYQRVEGSISDRMFSLNEINNGIKIKTIHGEVYMSVSQTRKGLIDRIVWLLEHSSLGLHNVSVSLCEKK